MSNTFFKNNEKEVGSQCRRKINTKRRAEEGRVREGPAAHREEADSAGSSCGATNKTATGA